VATLSPSAGSVLPKGLAPAVKFRELGGRFPSIGINNFLERLYRYLYGLHQRYV
jgi:hypothetical protein